MHNGHGFAEIDLSNMLTKPSEQTHGLVWKVAVNGYDAQDEFDMLPPLGVGRHKFEVYFNRPMNKAVAPTIAMGLRAPYTQNAIAEEGAWNDAGDVYTAYFTITGKQQIDGLNTIYVADAQDDEYFTIPCENVRFHVNVQSAGSMSDGFMAEPGLGKVNLTWDNPEENFDDMLGYNMYRYTVAADGTRSDTTRVNTQLIEPTATALTDFNVKTGTTYCYFYKVMRTSLTELDPSKTVSATPLTAKLGDANGTDDVNVADILSTVSYAVGENPQPFIFEAADINADSEIDILDVVGIARIISGTDAASAARGNASYYIENGHLYVNSDVPVAGVEVHLATENDGSDPLTPSASLAMFEKFTNWKTPDEFVFFAFNFNRETLQPGVNEICAIGYGDVSKLILSDAMGNEIAATRQEESSITSVEVADNKRPAGIYNLLGVKVRSNGGRLPAGVYIINGEKCVK